MINLDYQSSLPLYRQIHRQLKSRICTGTYQPGSPLPSIRSLSNSLYCSRNTVECAYQMLMKEGLVHSRPGSGYRVSDNARTFIASCESMA